MSEQVTYETAAWKLVLSAEPREGLRWIGSEYMEREVKTRGYRGAGVLFSKVTTLIRPFQFATDVWHEEEHNWRRSLDQSVIAFIDQRGVEHFPEVLDQIRLTSFLFQRILGLLDGKPSWDVFPWIGLRPLPFEELLDLKIVAKR